MGLGLEVAALLLLVPGIELVIDEAEGAIGLLGDVDGTERDVIHAFRRLLRKRSLLAQTQHKQRVEEGSDERRRFELHFLGQLVARCPDVANIHKQ